MILVTHAYHVTNVEVIINLDGSVEPHPEWTELTTSPALDRNFDQGGLYGQQCVFFSTTLYSGGLPTISVYPKSIRQAGNKYWRVKVPLSTFNDCIIRWCADVHDQRMLAMCKPDRIIGSIDLTGTPDHGFLGRDAHNNWYSNDYRNPATKYFVNFAVLGNVDITVGCEWDDV